jgi:hypothetical protein
MLLGAEGSQAAYEAMVARAVTACGVDEGDARKMVFDKMLNHDIEMKKLAHKEQLKTLHWRRSQRALERRDTLKRQEARERWAADVEARRKRDAEEARRWDLEARARRERHAASLAAAEQRHAAGLAERREALRARALSVRQRALASLAEARRATAWRRTVALLKADVLMVLVLDAALAWGSLRVHGAFAGRCGADGADKVSVPALAALVPAGWAAGACRMAYAARAGLGLVGALVLNAFLGRLLPGAGFAALVAALVYALQDHVVLLLSRKRFAIPALVVKIAFWAAVRRGFGPNGACRPPVLARALESVARMCCIGGGRASAREDGARKEEGEAAWRALVDVVYPLASLAVGGAAAFFLCSETPVPCLASVARLVLGLDEGPLAGRDEPSLRC